VNIASGLIDPIHQAARAASMFGIVFDNLAVAQGVKHMIKKDCLLGHFLLGVLRDPDFRRHGLAPDSRQDRLHVAGG
jgi:hypothetical protein